MAIDDRFTQDPRESPDDRLQGVRSEIITGPVGDWATDFSHLEPECSSTRRSTSARKPWPA